MATRRTHTPHQRRIYLQACVWCGRGFRTSRPVARFCRGVCRQSAYRYRQKNGRDPDAPQVPPCGGSGRFAVETAEPLR